MHRVVSYSMPIASGDTVRGSRAITVVPPAAIAVPAEMSFRADRRLSFITSS